MTKIYRDYTQEELDQQYNQATLVSNIPDYTNDLADLTAKAKASVACREDIAYGDHADERLDIYLPDNLTSPAPIRIFIHGGAWKGNSKEHAGGAAASFVSHGAIYVAVEFSLAPEASLDRMVDQARRAVWFTYQHGAEYGGDPNKIYLAGHSSGAHMAAMMTR